ncbi:TPA: 50S ribosomal protein L19e [archaeon]|uniref:Large ribosomal subunit protein eL19 n=1 Tax=Candidatus Naiadarchaeum limnaeum TaxID=2756139 RepID=A0A832V086_9ARCH|nr:50S ribosomal protein L19e [Candidatus Naiadarchaeum limnaeum]
MATTLETQKRIAARILKCGTSRIWIDPDAVNEVATAMTSGDVRKYIGLGFIKEIPVIGISRGRFRHRKLQFKKGRRRGYGSRSGAKFARTPGKEKWMRQIRAQRRLLQELRTEKTISNDQFRKIYTQLKSGIYKSKAHLLAYLKEQGVKFKKRTKKEKK